MEKNNKLKTKRLFSELNQGMELAYQLKNHLDSSTEENCGILLNKILSCYDKALQMLELSILFPEVNVLESSPDSFRGSSIRSEASYAHFDDKCKKNGRKRRKVLPSRSEQIWVESVEGQEGPLIDGYNWRKYGQKDILGTNFPRAYYRCTHRHSQGCLAIKHVQRSDNNPSIFQVTYRGRHTCALDPKQTTPEMNSLKKEIQKENKVFYQPQQQQQQEQEFQKLQQETFCHFDPTLKSKSQDLDENDNDDEDIFSFLTFPSTQIEPEENNFLGTFSSTTSESSYVNSLEMIESYNLQSEESNLVETISNPTSVSNSPIEDLDFFLEQVDFESDLPFDIIQTFT